MIPLSIEDEQIDENMHNLSRERNRQARNMEESPIVYSPVNFLTNASQGLLSSQPWNASMSRDSEHHDRLAEQEHTREKVHVSRGTSTESPLMPAHVLSSRHPSTSNVSDAGVPVITVSCGDDGTKVLFTGTNDEMSVEEYSNTI